MRFGRMVFRTWTYKRWHCFLLLLLYVAPSKTEQNGSVDAKFHHIDFYEEVMEDRYNLMSMSDSIYRTNSDIHGSYFAGSVNASIVSAPDHFKIPEYELDALQDLYDSTDGPHWNWFSFNASGTPWFFNSSSDPCAQRWQGLLCSQVPSNGYYNIIGMDLNLHSMVGEIPLSLFNLTKLRGINLASNYLFGHFPKEVTKWTELKVLDFSNNLIFGNIPHALCDLPAIQAIYMYNNYFNGTLPACLGQLVTLDVMKFTLNQLTGTIPASLGNLTNLELLYLGRNRLTGTIPPALGNMGNVTSFLLYENFLTGHIPESLMGLDNVLQVNLQKNRLSGTIPSVLASLTRCTFLYLSDNHFTGTISPLLASAPALQNFYMENNTLTGTIPPELTNITSMLSLDISYNQLHGIIPEALCNLPKLQILFLVHNYLTGTIPNQIGNISTLQTLDLSRNFFSGTLPESIGALQNVTDFYLSNNNLHGSVPAAMNNMSRMTFMSMFSGTLPPLSKLNTITSLFIESNQLTGTLDNIFEPARQRFLTLIQVSDNQLTGTLPDKIFDLPDLQTFIAVSNCFQGSLPVSICRSRRLKTLALDGLRSASSCRNLLLPGFSSSYVLTSEVVNGIPPCLFEMPRLNTLHLSGNDLTGTLPYNLNISASLKDISLSHNQLGGSIPYQLQDRDLYNLDLSFNKFSGTLSNKFGTIVKNRTLERRNDTRFDPDRNFTRTFFVNQSNLLLRNNRLSYQVPSVILDRINISVLQGNLFNCKLDESDLPEHDSGLSTYQCGSSTFNISFYFWLCATIVLVVIALLAYYWRERLTSYVINLFPTTTNLNRWCTIATWYNQTMPTKGSSIHYYEYVMMVAERVLQVAAYSMLYIVVVMLPLYTSLSAHYGTHSYQYAWTVSAAFLSGYPSTLAMLLLFLPLVALLLVLFRSTYHTLRRFQRELPSDLRSSVLDGGQNGKLNEKRNKSQYASTIEKYTIYAAFFLINVLVVAGLNTGYVYVSINENRKYIVVVQIGLSIFKLAWNNYGSKFLFRWTHHYLASSATKDWKTKGSGFFAIQLSMSLLNYIAIPCLVVAVVSPNCINSLIKGMPSVTSHYFYEFCAADSVHFGCVIYAPAIASTTYNPPFTYSYQCSSSLITYYAPTFVYLCIITVFVNPLMEVCMQQAHQRATKGTWWAALLNKRVPLYLRELSAETCARRPYSVFRPHFDANLFLVTIITYLAVLLTFGLVFPPISVVMVVCICGVVYTTKIKIGRFLTNAADPKVCMCTWNVWKRSAMALGAFLS